MFQIGNVPNKKNNKVFGKIGEAIAFEFLKKKGYMLLELNFRCNIGEIDIIAKKEKVLVFCEVKLRSGEFFGYPIESIDMKKIKKIRSLALAYVLRKAFYKDYDIRFDIIEIIIDSWARDFIKRNIDLLNPEKSAAEDIRLPDTHFVLRHTKNAF